MRFSRPINTEPADPIDEIKAAFRDNGIALPDKPFEFNGKVQRFRADLSKPKDNDNGWCIFYKTHDIVYGTFGDWASGLKVSFKSSGYSLLTVTQKAEIDRLTEEAAKKAEAERDAQHEKVSGICENIWKDLKEAPADHPYLVKKGLNSAHGARLSGEAIVIPLKDSDGRIWSLQYINGEGDKKYKSGGKTKGMFIKIGNGDPAYMCEGFATGCSILEATDKAVIVTFSANNLVECAKTFKDVVVVADNDESQTGEIKAKETKLPYILIPEVDMDANDYATKYGREALAKLLTGKKSYRVHSGIDWLVQAEPRSWLIKNWVLKGPALQMTFGASGGGKTFINIDRMMSIATGLKATKSKVLYLCGEGAQSAQSRVAVWVQEHQDINLEDLKQNLLISEEDFKLDTPEGIKLINSIIEDFEFTPDLVIVDTLIRFMDGDENDTKAANQFITYCNEIQNKYSCTLLLTHHTGLAEEAQKRARGSSAFKGALDMQDMVTKNGEKVTVTQVKNKGGKIQEPVTYELEDHAISNFFEDDGSNMKCAILIPCEASAEDIETDKRTRKTVQLFIDGGYVFNGENRMSRDKAREILRRQKIEETPQDPDESDEAFEKRIGTNVRQALKRLFADNPLVQVVRSDSKGNPTEYLCKSVELDGFVQPDFTLKLMNKFQT